MHLNFTALRLLKGGKVTPDWANALIAALEASHINSVVGGSYEIKANGTSLTIPPRQATPTFPFKCTGFEDNVNVEGGMAGDQTADATTVDVGTSGIQYVVVLIPCDLTIDHEYVYDFTQNAITIDVSDDADILTSEDGSDFQIAVAKFVDGRLDTQYNTSSIALNVVDASSAGTAQGRVIYAF